MMVPTTLWTIARRKLGEAKSLVLLDGFGTTTSKDSSSMTSTVVPKHSATVQVALWVIWNVPDLVTSYRSHRE